MTDVTSNDKEDFFKDVETAAKKAIWCALATVEGNAPRVRMVHPTWEGDVLWIATSTQSPKAQQLLSNGNVDIQFQVAPDDFVHLLVRGSASVITDAATKERVWDVMDYDLGQFWPAGPNAEEFCAIKVQPSRVELSEMFGMANKRVWRASSAK